MVILICLPELHHHNSVPMLRGHRIRDFRSEKEYEARCGWVSSRFPQVVPTYFFC